MRDGARASLLPCFLGDGDPELVRLLDPPPELVEDVHLLLHERGRRTRPVWAVEDALGRLFRGAADALSGTGAAFAPDAGSGEASLPKPASAPR